MGEVKIHLDSEIHTWIASQADDVGEWIVIALREKMEGVASARRDLARELGAKGGRKTSERKRAAVRENARKGGRPRKDGTPTGSKPCSICGAWTRDVNSLGVPTCSGHA